MGGLSSDKKCVAIADDDPFFRQSEQQRPPLGSIEATFSEGGDEVLFYTGYSALQIATRRAQEVGGHVYTNDISSRIKRENMNRPVSYAVSKTPVYTLMPPDDGSDRVLRCYWSAHQP
jgi:hypothetical protein